MGLFLKFIWQFGDVVEFWLWGLILPWQQHFEGHVWLKFEFFYLFFTLNWIVVLGVEYFGSLEHYLFEKNAISDFLVDL